MEKKILIAGPCVIETTDVMESVAEELVRICPLTSLYL